MCHDVVDPSGKCPDWASLGARWAVADATASRTVFLVGDTHYSGSRSVEDVEGGGVGNDVVVLVVENDVACTELFCTAIRVLLVSRILTDPEQVVKGNGGHIAAGLDLVRGGAFPDIDEVFDYGHGYGKLVLGWWVLAAVGFYLSLKLQPVLALASVGGVRESLQFEGLADGTKRDLNGASSDLRAFAVITSPAPDSEAEKEVNSVGSRDICEHGVHAKWLDEFAPKLPIALPFVVIRSHDPSVDVSPRSSEKIRELNLSLSRKTRHESSCNGK